MGAVAATIVLSLITTTLADLRSGSVSTELAAARTNARNALDAYRTELDANPSYFLSEVALSERARVCDPAYGGGTVQPGSAWPERCGGVWTYAQPSLGDDVRIEVVPPGPDDGRLVLTAVARSGNVSGGWRQVLAQRALGQWTVATETSLDLGAVNTTGTPNLVSAYSGGDLFGGGAFTTAVLAAEGTVGATPAAGSVAYAGTGQPGGVRTDASAGAYVSQTAVDATGTPASERAPFSVRVRLALPDWTPASAVGIAQRWDVTSTARQEWRLRLTTAGRLVFDVRAAGGVRTYTSDVLGVADGATAWVEVSYQPQTGSSVPQVSFVRGSDAAVPAWTAAGTATGTGTGAVAATAQTLDWGRASSGTTNLAFTGTLYAAEVRRGQTVLSSVDFASPAYSIAQTTLADAYGETYTLVGGARLVSSGARSETVGSIRSLLAGPLRVGALNGSAEAARRLGCPSGDHTANVTVSGQSRAPRLCLTRGGQFVTTGGEVVTVPVDVSAYLLVFEGDSVAVRYTQSTSTGPAGSENLIGASAGYANVNGHPGELGYWTLAGTAYLPANGVVTTDTDVHLGLCGAAYRTGGACASYGATGASAPSGSVTVIAGTATSPADVWLSGPVDDANGTLSAYAFGYVVVPYWARALGTDLATSVNVGAGGYGIGPSGARYTDPVQYFPADVDRAVNPPTGTLNWRGSVTARSVSFSPFGTFANATLAPTGRGASRPSPWAPAFDQRWGAITDTSVSAQSVCGGDCTSSWYGS